MLIGYLNLAPEQLAGGLSAPHNALIACGVGRLYIDFKAQGEVRPQLDAALVEISARDVLVSPTVNTLTDCIAGLLAIHARLDAKGASLRLLELAGGLPLDTSSTEGRAILTALAVMHVLPAIAGFSCSATVAPGPSATLTPRSDEQRPRGRPVTASNKAPEINRLYAQGLRAVEIAAHLGIGRASVYRILSQGHTAGDPLEYVADPAAALSSRIVGRFVAPDRR